MTTVGVLRLEQPATPDPEPVDATRFGEFDVPSEDALAKAWGVHPRTVYKMALPFVYVGRHRFYPWARVVEEMRRRAK